LEKMNEGGRKRFKPGKGRREARRCAVGGGEVDAFCIMKNSQSYHEKTRGRNTS